MARALLQKLHVKEALAMSLETKKMIEKLSSFEKRTFQTQQYRDGKLW